MRDQIRELWTQVNLLKRLTQRVPLRHVVGSGSSGKVVIQVQGGNTFGTVNSITYTGIKPLSGASTISTVPTAAPIAATTYADGLGYGQIVTDGVPGGALVWIASKAKPSTSATSVQEYQNHMITGCYITSRMALSVLIGAGPTTAVVYLPFEV